jgi:hypothetical protein
MGTSRRVFLGGAAAAAGLSLVPVRAHARIEREKSYGVVEIATAGMTVSVYRFDIEALAAGRQLSGADRMVPERTGRPFSEMTNPLGPDVDPAQAAQAVAVVAGYIDALKSEFGVAPEDIAVLLSSGVADFAPDRAERFTADLRARTGYQADIISIREQARLGFDWIVRRGRRDNVLHFDIGSGYTKGGYYAPLDGGDQFFDLSAPFGTKTMAGAVKRRWPEVRTADFGPRSAQFYGDTLEPVLAPQVDAAPAPAERAELCLSGGIVWASTAILQPEALARQQPWVELAPDHFAALLRLVEAGTPYGGRLPARLGDATRERVLATLDLVRRTFNPHELAAGAAIGDGLARQLRFADRKQLVFASFAGSASNLWSSQYLIEKFG